MGAYEDLESRYRVACQKIYEEIREEWTPKKTGNLAYNALRYDWEGADGKTFHMYIDEDIAPYAVFVNEAWKSPYWRGKKNPNEGWWNAACEYFRARLAEELGARTEEEIEEGIDD